MFSIFFSNNLSTSASSSNFTSTAIANLANLCIADSYHCTYWLKNYCTNKFITENVLIFYLYFVIQISKNKNVNQP